MHSEGEGYSTDEFDIDEEEDPEDRRGPAPASDSSASSTASKRERLPGHVLSQLAADINAKGGIDKFGLESQLALALLCDQRPELYGSRGSRLRYRVGKKVDRWKGKVKANPLAWLKILKDLQVTEKPTAAQLKKAKAQSSEKVEADELDEQSEQASKKLKSAKTEQIEDFDCVSSPGIPSSVTYSSVPNEAMSEDDLETYFPSRNIDPDLLLPQGAELSKCLCCGPSFEFES